MCLRDIPCGMSDCDFNIDDYCTHRIDNIMPNSVKCPRRHLFWVRTNHARIDEILQSHARVVE